MNGQLTVVGLGTGDHTQLTLGIWQLLQSAKHLYVRTEHHPVMEFLRDHQIRYTTFDSVYEAHDSFPEVYDEIAHRLIDKARELPEENIIYAVPGHPMVAESTVSLLKERCPEAGVELRILGGESFLDQAFIRLGFDPIDGFQLIDASEVSAAVLSPQLNTVIGQVYDVFTASDVKLGLMELYPDDFEIVVGHALGIPSLERIVRIPLHELDRIEGYGNLSLIWVPKTDNQRVHHRTFAKLKEIVNILRSPGGCPWDQEQTHQSIRKNLIEETYEVLETIDDDDPTAMQEELGDLLMQIMLHSQMEDEAGAFNVYDVIQGLNDKLIFRHPHVFGDRHAEDAQSALGNWEQMKAEEKRLKGMTNERTSALDGVPRDLPALMKAYKLQKKAAKVGFDWDCVEDVLDKVAEELQELQEAVKACGTKAKEEDAILAAQEELGDLLFAAVNVSRFINVDPEEALTMTNRKFVKRFRYIEEQLRINGKSFDQTDLLEMEQWWQEAKRL
ncbi:bifunctional methyltransferase/pyrophosphohydrolase YabN [Paenibacillus marinisediminis]